MPYHSPPVRLRSLTPDHISIADAASLHGSTTTNIYQHAINGVFNAYKHRGRVYVSREQVIKHLEERSIRSAHKHTNRQRIHTHITVNANNALKRLAADLGASRGEVISDMIRKCERIYRKMKAKEIAGAIDDE